MQNQLELKGSANSQLDLFEGQVGTDAHQSAKLCLCMVHKHAHTRKLCDRFSGIHFIQLNGE